MIQNNSDLSLSSLLSASHTFPVMDLSDLNKAHDITYITAKHSTETFMQFQLNGCHGISIAVQGGDFSAASIRGKKELWLIFKEKAYPGWAMYATNGGGIHSYIIKAHLAENHTAHPLLECPDCPFPLSSLISSNVLSGLEKNTKSP